MTIEDVVRELSVGRWFVFTHVFVEVQSAEVADGRLRLWVPGANEYWPNDMECSRILRIEDGAIQIWSPLTVHVRREGAGLIIKQDETSWFLLREDKFDKMFLRA